MPGSPRGESPLVHRLQRSQRYASSLRNLRQRPDLRAVSLSKLLGVGGSFCRSSLVRFESSVIPAKHLFVSRLDLAERGEPPEVLEWSVDLTLSLTQFGNLTTDLGIGERHP